MVNQGPGLGCNRDMSSGICEGSFLHTQMGALPVSSFPPLSAAAASAVHEFTCCPGSAQCSKQVTPVPQTSFLWSLGLGGKDKPLWGMNARKRAGGDGVVARESKHRVRRTDTCLGRTGKVKSGCDEQQGQSSSP